MRKVLLDRRLKKVGPVGFLETHWPIVWARPSAQSPWGNHPNARAVFPNAKLGRCRVMLVLNLIELRSQTLIGGKRWNGVGSVSKH